LGTVDNRLYNLSRQNEDIEAIAQAIFKSWFVDFDPVRAKAEGREPEGMDADTAALFPSEFSSSEQGPIPIDWHFRRAGDLMEQSRESINPPSHPDKLFALYSLPAFDEGRRPRLEYGREIKSNKTVISAECILLSKLNPHIPRVWLPGKKIQKNAVCSTEFMVFQPATGFSVEYLYCQFVEPGFAQRFGGLTTGTSNSHQRVKPDYLLEEQLIEPTRAVVEAFTFVTHSLFEKINANIEAQQTLAELRDTLLPRLISGKLRVPEAEAMLMAV
jgi:type I restriction enzyme S subunit